MFPIFPRKAEGSNIRKHEATALPNHKMHRTQKESACDFDVNHPEGYMSSLLDSISKKPEEWETELLIDAMHYHNARYAHVRAIKAEKEIKKTKNLWERLEKKEKKILLKYNNNYAEAYNELEPICIQMEDAHYNIGKAYAPLLKEIASVHMLSLAALEAHINSIACEKLNGEERRQFEKISTGAKWLFLPKILKLQGFEPGRQPYQRFSKLIKYRNKLVHFKGITEPWIQGSAPNFIKELGLTITASNDSLKVVKDMISELSHQLAKEEPFWLHEDLNNISYFTFTIGKND